MAMAQLFVEIDAYYGETVNEPVETKVQQINSVLFADPPLAYSLLVSDGTKLVGFAGYSFLWPAVCTTKSLYLKELYVSKDYRRGGIGKMLMDEIIKVAADADCSRIEWTTDDDNVEARQFYQQLGFSSLPSKVFYRIERS
jgi:ribosomal protein S18 acetylase RimI-like enzyme